MTRHLTILLDGITAGDYLAWIRDPEPPALGRDLRSVTVEADPVGNRIDLELTWNRPPPALEAAAADAGFPLTPEVVAVQDRRGATDPQEKADPHNSQVQIARIEARVDRRASRATDQRSVGTAVVQRRPRARSGSPSLARSQPRSTRTHS